jgi:hypothetical protein
MILVSHKIKYTLTMAAPAHLPPAALDHSSLPTRPIATKFKDNLLNYLNNDRVNYGVRKPLIRYRIVSTTVEGRKPAKMIALTMTMALYFDSSGVRVHTIPCFSSILKLMLYLPWLQRSRFQYPRGWGRNDSRISHKSHRVWGITSPIQRQAGPTDRHSCNNQTDGIRSKDNSESAWDDPDYRPSIEWSYHRRCAGSLEPA